MWSQTSIGLQLTPAHRVEAAARAAHLADGAHHAVAHADIAGDAALAPGHVRPMQAFSTQMPVEEVVVWPEGS